MSTIPIAIRLLRLCLISDDCWIWLGHHAKKNSTPSIKAGGKNGRPLSAKRVAWNIFRGEIPNGMHIVSSCGNNHCISPKHLVATEPKQIGLFDSQFWSNIDKTDNCWLWIGEIDKDGYGRVGRSKYYKKRLAHRVSWVQYYGEIPDGLCVLHKCDIRNCVNPDHLFLGFPKENSLDMRKKGRQAKGETNARTTLTWSQVDQIRDAFQEGTSMKLLAQTFSVSWACIWDIVNFRSWNKP